MSTSSISLSVCQYRILADDKRCEGRRFVFEIYAHSKSIVLQTETEAEMYEWLNIIELSKEFCHLNATGQSTFKEEKFIDDSSSDESNEEEKEEKGKPCYSEFMAKRNEELHRLLKSVPIHDYGMLFILM